MKRYISNVILVLVGGFFSSLLIFSIWKEVAQYYVVFLGILACGSFLLLCLNPKLKANLVIALVTTGFSVLAVELILTIWEPQLFTQITKLSKNGTGSEHLETGSRLGTVRDLQEIGIQAVPSLSTPDLLGENFRNKDATLLPLAGISNQTTVLCNGFDGPIMYNSDRHGFNNPTDYWHQKDVQYAVIGDSFVHGRCPAKVGIVEAFREAYPDTLNLGLTGSGPLMELAILKEYLSTIKPPVVLWFYFEGNDLDDLLRESGHLQLKQYWGQDYSQGLMLKQKIIDRALKQYVDGLTHVEKGGKEFSFWEVIKLNELRHRVFSVMNICPLDTSVRAIPKFERLVVDMTQTVDSWGGDLYFIYLPTWERYSGTTDGCGEDRFLASSKQYGEVLDILRSHDTEIIDIVRVFNSHPDALALWPFRENGHYNAVGNQLVAETVISHITNR